ncbi:hypothetical protein HUA78_33380, partial [Myxococcus sp. CA033]|uniref:hypothetical protein n=1 Tax=Myxococcus sp. CA033 TaxID=2741516 RepID=UPI00157A73D1
MLAGPYLADKEGLRGIPDIVVRHLVPSGGFGRVWVDSIYVGTPACVLALGGLIARVRSPRAWVLAGAWLLVLALSLGDALPVYGWVYQVFPPWRPFRYPEKLYRWPHWGSRWRRGWGGSTVWAKVATDARSSGRGYSWCCWGG